MREHGYTAMHIACGDITEVEKNGDEIIIKTKEQFLIDLLEREDNKKILQDAFCSQGINKYKIEKKDKKSDLAQIDVEKLRTIFTDKLVIE